MAAGTVVLEGDPGVSGAPDVEQPVTDTAPASTTLETVDAPALAPVAIAPIPATGGDSAPAAVPGAYLPPSTVHRPVPSPATSYAPVQATTHAPVQATSYAPPAPTARTGAGSGAPAPSTGSWMPPTTAASPVAATLPPVAPVPGRASLFADLPFDTPDSLAEWLVAAGSIASAVSFLLPWAPNIVTYTSSWGLSSASRVPVLAILMVAAVLAVLPNRVATWVRLGVLGLIGGSLYLGILWPYVFGDFGAEFGSVIGAAGAIVLLVGGIVGVAPHRDSGAS